MRGWLRFHRGALEAKCAGLASEQLVDRSVPPSRLSLLGLVRHLTEMERIFLALPLKGLPAQLLYCTDANPDGDFDLVRPEASEEDLQRWHSACAESDNALAVFASLDVVVPKGTCNVRWLLQKLTGEYTRHNGHADLIRQAIDGATGE